MVNDSKTVQYTDIQLQFLNLLQKYPVKTPETIVDYITSQGETVLEDPEKLAQSLSECEITPVRRRQILKHWFADKGVPVTEDLLQKVALPPQQRKGVEDQAKAEEEKRKAKYSVDQDTGVLKVATEDEKALTWDEAEKLSRSIKKEIGEKGKRKGVTYVYDTESEQVRMAKEGETGGTLEQAKELKKMAEAGKVKKDEVTYVYDTESEQVRMAKEGEIGGTFEQAKELKKMADEGKVKKDEVTYVYDTESGQVRMAKEGEVGGTFEQAKELKKMADEGKVKKDEVTYVYDTESEQVRIAKEGEIGGTFEQAKELKKMADEGKAKKDTEPPFIMGEGGWTLNPKAKITGVDLMTFDAIRRTKDKGEPVDINQILDKTVERMELYQRIFGGGGGKQIPEWMTDPLKFAEFVSKFTGGGKADETLKNELTEMKKTIEEMKDERYRQQIEAQKQQIQTLSEKIEQLTDFVTDMKKPVTGRSEMDIIHDVATRGIDLAKAELSGLRSDIREAFRSGKLPPPKTPQQQLEQKEKIRLAVQKDSQIEELGKNLFWPAESQQ